MQLRPQFPEGRLPGHHLPGDAVEIGEDKGLPGRPDEKMAALDDPAAFHPHQGHGAGAVRLVVGSFEIDGDKR